MVSVCQVSPEREGPLFFSDSGIGIHVISHTFFLKDSSARGFQRQSSLRVVTKANGLIKAIFFLQFRWFSIIISAHESALLLASWNTLIPEIKLVIGDLQQMAARVYQSEEEHCSHRMLRSNLNNSSVGAARAVQDLTANANVLQSLHAHFTRIILMTVGQNVSKTSSETSLPS